MSSSVVTIHADHHSPRLHYILDWVLRERLGLSWTYDHNPSSQLTISYGADVNADIYIPSHGLLYETRISSQSINIKTDVTGTPYFFSIEQKSESWEFDVLSCIFYLISRYEEYLPHDADEHGRYLHTSSLAYRAGFLSIPLVDVWIERLRDQIEEIIGHPLKTISYRSLATIDIDLPYAYRYHGMKRWYALMRDIFLLRISRVRHRLQYLSSDSDPFDTYEYLLDRLPDESITFFLMNDGNAFDENHIHDHPLMQQIVKRMNRKTKIGIHPSYASHESTVQLQTEIDRLTHIHGEPVTSSRQHFLKMKMPNTYRQLISIGITEDHSMMYAGAAGFRASTCHPFYWYDIEADEVTPMRIISPCVMDVTLRDYENLSPDQAVERSAELRYQVKKYNGVFSFIWHNSSFSSIHGWAGWRQVYEYLVNN